jgi:hypothetical protein
MSVLLASVTARLVFDGVANLGSHWVTPPQPDWHMRQDPGNTIAWGRFIIANANGSTHASTDGGATWHAQKAHVPRMSVPSGPNVRHSIDNGLSAYSPNASTHFEAAAYDEWSVDPTTGNFSWKYVEKPAAVTFSGLPWATYLFAPSAGGVATLADGTHVMTTSLWGAPSAPPYPHPDPGKPPGPCCNGSVGVFSSADGFAWEFISFVAQKSDIEGSQEGPNENSIVLLKDKLTLAVVFRTDGARIEPPVAAG